MSETELGAIWARVLTVSRGCPTRTCAAPPKLPAMSSLTVSKVLCGMTRPGRDSVSKEASTAVSKTNELFLVNYVCTLDADLADSDAV